MNKAVREEGGERREREKIDERGEREKEREKNEKCGRGRKKERQKEEEDGGKAEEKRTGFREFLRRHTSGCSATVCALLACPDAQVIEQELGRKADIELLPMQPGDVERTSAGVEKAHRLLGFQPKVDIRQGIRAVFSFLLSPLRSFLFLQQRKKR